MRHPTPLTLFLGGRAVFGCFFIYARFPRKRLKILAWDAIFYKKSIKLRFVWYMVDVGRSNVARLMTSQSQFFFKKMGPPPTVWALVPRNGLSFWSHIYRLEDNKICEQNHQTDLNYLQRERRKLPSNFFLNQKKDENPDFHADFVFLNRVLPWN